jgi:transcriptional regulator of acetoin/glycerol metabolism
VPSAATLDRLNTPKYAEIESARPAQVPGVVVVFAQGQPCAVPLPIGAGPVELGRDHPALAARPDPHISRRHLRVTFNGSSVVATDLHSSNGTVVDGATLRPGVLRDVSRVIRIGETLLVPSPDVRPLQEHGVRTVAGRIEGPRQRAALDAARHAANLGRTLHIIGESGTGKEAVARAFHAAGPASRGPFQVWRCSPIPQAGLDELVSHLRAAHGGTLLLEDVAELSSAVQAAILAAVEHSEVLPEPHADGHDVDVRVCFAASKDLRVHVEAGRLREDLYYRIATPRVYVPPLRDRPEEIPWLLQAELHRVAPEVPMHVSLVEACLMRVWPGNIRELLAEARGAAQTVIAEGASLVEAGHLDAAAGTGMGTPPSSGRGKAARSAASTMRARIATALDHSKGNVSAAARELGVHRTQLRRWLERYAMDARAFTTDESKLDT